LAALRRVLARVRAGSAARPEIHPALRRRQVLERCATAARADRDGANELTSRRPDRVEPDDERAGPRGNDSPAGACTDERLDNHPFALVEIRPLQRQRLHPQQAERRLPPRPRGGAHSHDQGGGRDGRCGYTHTVRVAPSRRRTRAGAACATAVAAALAASGCDSNDQAVDPGRVSRLVLRAGDLPKQFAAFDVGPVQRRDTPPGPREDPRRFNRESGWKARFRRSGNSQTPGPLVIESRADVFAGADGAGDELAAFRIQYEELLEQRGVRGRRLAAPEVGSEAVAFSLLQAGDPSDVRFYVVAWRVENVVASLVVSGFEPRLSLAQTIALARRQERRIQEQLPS
jgi:hypothetical protein